MRPTPVVFSGAARRSHRTRSSELCYAPEQLDADTFRDAFALCFSSAWTPRPADPSQLLPPRDVGTFVCYVP